MVPSTHTSTIKMGSTDKMASMGRNSVIQKNRISTTKAATMVNMMEVAWLSVRLSVTSSDVISLATGVMSPSSPNHSPSTSANRSRVRSASPVSALNCKMVRSSLPAAPSATTASKRAGSWLRIRSSTRSMVSLSITSGLELSSANSLWI